MRSWFLAILLLFVTGLLFGNKLVLRKQYSNSEPRRHPHTQLLNKRPLGSGTRDANYQKLLVILVDFQEEIIDDPNTTGNGKFLLQPDPDYLHTIASPPHDRDYFLNNLEALRYYYLAASHGSYDLQYDIYPQDGSAYTLPQPMGYYNPPYADGNLFVQRMEEYFKTSFELADSLSPEIDFSVYGHFMIIHAGSDWQHDVFGDTPSDIPSFFIRVGEGKEAVVDDGAVLIRTACNVPSTISQDFQSRVYSYGTVHSGYGALNAVLAHEFGHSLGLVDLYNVYNFQPMVGVFDIMDSGGSGILWDELDNGDVVMIEGGLPVLPGAWSRLLLFEDHFASQGYLKDIDQITLFSPLELAASSHKQTGNVHLPQILRFPLSPTEYILVENRNVDPDNDGGTAVFATDDFRVILYPTAFNDPLNNPSYEYDYLLPSFQRADGAAVGGGILVWHINDDVIYNQGVTNSDGIWVSNFDNNTVNRLYSNRGVKVIEADGLPDIGYDWSWYWTGTQYEYFHQYRPVLDSDGYFVSWSLEQWKPWLNSTGIPPLQDSQGLGSQYWLSEIGNPQAVMNLTLRSGSFSHTQIFDLNQASLIAAPVINSSFGNPELPLVSFDKINLLSYDGTSWTDLMGDFGYSGAPVSQPVVRCDQNSNGYQELVLSRGNSIELLEFADDDLSTTQITFPENLSTAPLPFADGLFVATPSTISLVRNNAIAGFVSVPGTLRLGSYQDKLVALASNTVCLIDPGDVSISAQIVLPESFGDYEPVAVYLTLENKHLLFLMANSGNIYRYDQQGLHRIFLNTSASLPTQLGISIIGGTSPALFWAASTRIYAIKLDGSLISGYPYDAFPLSFSPREHVYSRIAYRSLEANVRADLLFLPVAGRGHVAYWGENGIAIAWDKSMLTTTNAHPAHFHIEPVSNSEARLFWYYMDLTGDLYIHSIDFVSLYYGMAWNGYRNAASGMIGLQGSSDTPPLSTEFSAWVYPSPVRGDQYRLRVVNADADVQIKLYNIKGSLIFSSTAEDNGLPERDIQLDSSRLASGVYILSLSSGNNHRRIKFAVEK